MDKITESGFPPELSVWYSCYGVAYEDSRFFDAGDAMERAGLIADEDPWAVVTVVDNRDEPLL